MTARKHTAGCDAMGQTHRAGGYCYGTCDHCGANFKRVAKGQAYRFCSKACSVEPVLDRIMRKLQGNNEAGGCLIWIGKKNKEGYGEIQHEEKLWKIHRLFWTIWFGAIPDGIEVCHRCDNPSCVRLDHLFLGTHAENMQDMARKGRGRYPNTKGEAHGAAKLSNAIVVAIRNDGRTQQEIADDVGISQSLVSQIKRRKIWRHLP